MLKQLGARGSTVLPWAVLLIFCAGWTLAIAGFHRGHVGDLVDDGIYFVSAQSLRDGTGFTLPSRPGVPACPRYPIGFPFLLSLGLRFAPGVESLARDISIARWIVIVCSWCFFVGCYVLLRNLRVHKLYALLIVGATMCHPLLLESYFSIMSDVPFAAAATVAATIWTSRRFVKEAGERAGAGLGLSLAASWLLRRNGLTLILATFVSALRGRFSKRYLLGAAAGFVTLVAPLDWYAARFTRGLLSTHYANNLRYTWFSVPALLSIVSGNAIAMWNTIAVLILPPMAANRPLVAYLAAHPLLSGMLRFAVIVPVVIGIVRFMFKFGKRYLALWLHAALSIVIYLTHSWQFGARYLLFLIPLLFLAFGAGVAAVIRPFNLSSRHVGLVTALLIFAMSTGFMARVSWIRHAHNGLLEQSESSIALNDALRFIRDDIPKNAVVASLMPEMVFLYTGHQSVPLIDDDKWLRHDYGGDDLSRWIGTYKEKPFYIFSSIPDPNGDVDAAQIAALRHDPALRIEQRYKTSGSEYLIFEVSMVQSAKSQ